MSIQTIRSGALEYQTAEGISVPHCFTTRLGGVSTGSQASLNLAVGRGDTLENVEENLKILGNTLGFDLKKLVMTRQTHSDIVRAVTAADANGPCHKDYPECDGLVTNTPGVALLVFTADCTPILLHDPVTGAVGAVHAGWRGTVQAIAAKAVEAMAEHYGSKPENIRSAIGPNIGACHFDTHRDVPDALEEALGSWVWKWISCREGKYFPDLKQINSEILRLHGVKQVEISEECTYCAHQRFWSHRYTKGDRGSQGALIVCREVCL